uniref:CPSF_A domain-containing protein n=1 Tax=Rhodnius prolixus TaxID=13249 RepID=T1HGH0_RHOPR
MAKVAGYHGIRLKKNENKKLEKDCGSEDRIAEIERLVWTSGLRKKSCHTFGVITTRLDVQGLSGLEVQRECASTRAQMTSNSQNSSLAIAKPVGAAQSVDLGVEVEVHHFLLFDQHTFEVLHAHQMLPTEYALSLVSCKLGDDPNAYYVVGTGIVNPEENEPKQGRIIMFQVDDGRLIMVCEKEVKGGCYSLAEFNGKLLASINTGSKQYLIFLKISDNSPKNLRHLVLSLSGEEVEETEIFGFQSEHQTMYCGNVGADAVVQVVPQYVRLISLEPKQVLSEWKPSSGRNISIVAANTLFSCQVVCASGSDLFYLEICSSEIVEKKHVTLEHEVSCLDVTPFPDEKFAKFVAIGLWNDMSARILKLPSLEEIHREYLGGGKS